MENTEHKQLYSTWNLTELCSDSVCALLDVTGRLLLYVLFPSLAFCHHILKLQACVSRMYVSWCGLGYHLIITRLFLGTPTVLKLKEFAFWSWKKGISWWIFRLWKVKKSWNLFSSAAKMFSIPIEVKLLQTTLQITQLLPLYAFDSSVGYFATCATADMKCSVLVVKTSLFRPMAFSVFKWALIQIELPSFLILYILKRYWRNKLISLVNMKMFLLMNSVLSVE